MIKIRLDNKDNDKIASIELPIVPRIGDWINTSELEDDEFSQTGLPSVVNVILHSNGEIICVVSDEYDLNIFKK